jgi:hypothetical protein
MRQSKNIITDKEMELVSLLMQRTAKARVISSRN